jgi:4-hydroxybutyryl-CoA dehydratase / vinylacetyl-CoA-Delta-isomerase
VALRTGAQYRQAIQRLRPNVYKWDQLIEDVTTHPATRLHVDSVAHSYDAAFDPAQAAIFSLQSPLTGQPAHRWNTLLASPEHAVGNARMKRAQFQHSGTCQGATCAGWTGLNALWAVTWEMDRALGTSYHGRLGDYFRYIEAEGCALAGALTDAKGDRSKRPSQQGHLDANLRVKEVRSDGIVVRGVKAQICGVAAAHEVVCFPGTAYGAPDKAYAVAFAVPRDVPGLRIVETRRPSDTRDEEDGWDAPKIGGITQAWLLFDDVFVPNERVFLCGEHDFTGKLISWFSAIYRAAIGACVAGQGDVMIGAALGLARANGLSQKVFQEKLSQMAINNEVTFGLGMGAVLLGKPHPSGLWIADPLLAHVNKVQVARLPYETKLLAQEIGGGIAETGCLPSYRDLQSERYGGELQAALAAGEDGETRARLARLVEWLTIGGGVAGCMHGGGSPDGARLVVKALEPWDELARNAGRIAGVKAAEPDLATKAPLLL